MKHRLTMVVLGAAMCLSVGCSQFERDWGRAVPGRMAQPAPGARQLASEGAWIGTWRSEKTGHSGALRCLVQQPSGSGGAGGQWDFRYHARWGMLSGEFRTAQPVRKGRAGVLVSRGVWTLPAWAGGTYHYDIEITNTDFHGTYRSAGDHGTFSMRRPGDP